MFKKIILKAKKSGYFNFLNKNKSFNLMEVIAIMIITVIFGIFVGGIVMYKKGTVNYGIRHELNEFVDTYTEILNEYYDDIDEKGLLDAGVNGMINYLGDPYSVFMDEEETLAFNEKVNGEYVGIGVEIIQYSDLKVEVKNAYTDGPAYKAGIRNGDIFLKVDGEDITKKSINDISSVVKGKKGTKVNITILRGEEELEFTVTRGNIDIASVESKVIEYNNSKVGYIIIDLFAANTADQFKKHLESLEKEKINSLIIDVRGNSGGYLTCVSDIVNLFLKKGDLIYQLKTKNKIEKFYDKTDEHRSYKIAVLVNGGSASASELLTAALKDTYKAYTVGTITFGKGKVQKTHELSNGAMVKYTFQEWLRPNGENVDGKGIEPEYSIPYEDMKDENSYDSQLTKALDLLTIKEQ